MFGRKLKVISDPHAARLAEAKADSALARARIAEAKAAVDRVNAVLDAAVDADRAARQARAVANAAITKWSAAGADPQGRAEFERLEAEAVRADRAAEEAQVIAEAARAGLPAVQARVREAENAANIPLGLIHDIEGAIIIDEIRSTLDALEKSAQQYRAARHDLEALLGVVNSQSRFNPACMPYQNHLITMAIKPVLEQAAKDVREIAGYLETREDLHERRQQWEQRLQALQDAE
jgi:hypothetical protein